MAGIFALPENLNAMNVRSLISAFTSKRKCGNSLKIILLSFLFAQTAVAQFSNPIKMKKEIINTANAPQPIGPYSQAVAYGNLLFVSGQIAINPDNGELINSSINDETHQVMKNIQNILMAAGLDMEHILKTSIFLKNMDDFAEVNRVYGSYFKNHFPARETVQVSRLPKDVSVEISVIAAK
jgi:2-iminobutanoate/2-iminopropanoate deaminase